MPGRAFVWLIDNSITQPMMGKIKENVLVNPLVNLLTWGKIRVPARAQKAKVAAETPITPKVNRPATSSASRCTGAVRAWAVSTKRTMSAIAVSPPDRSARTVMRPSQFTVPAVTVVPTYQRPLSGFEFGLAISCGNCREEG